jgi:hypothetical protein
MNQPVLARAQQAQQQTEQLTGHAQQGAIVVGAARDPDFDRLLQREWSPREVLEEDNLTKMLKVAEMLASSKVSVPDHLRGNVGDCLAIVTQAMLWNMNPFAVAQKTHLVNGRLGYEAQLVNAVLQASGLVRGMPRYEYRGDAEGLECRVAFIPRGETEPLWGEWLALRAVTTRNSPLWKTNQRQQLGYLQIKNWARAFAPGAILGVYTVDELADIEPQVRDNDTAAPPPPAAPALPDYAADVLTESGERLGQTPLSRQLPRASGTQTIILRLPGYRDAQLSLSLGSDEEREAELVAAGPARGKLKNPSKRGGGKPRPGQGKHPADDTTILLDFKAKKVLK